MILTKEEIMLIWNTATLEEFSHLNFDSVLYPSNIVGTETYIKEDDNIVTGYEVRKRHKGQQVDTIYFVRSDDIPEMPLKIKSTRKILYAKKAYNLIIEADSMSITPDKIMNWRELIDYSGIPSHSNPIHYTLYKNKVLYGRTKKQVYYRTISESAFGKDKYKESVRLLLEHMSNLSDPTVSNLFYRACHNKDITICEMPDNTKKEDFIKLCNMLIRIGDGTKILDNRARKTDGTVDSAQIGKLSVSFIHNIPSYYSDKGLNIFEEIFPYNVINRYYYNLYDGFLQASFPSDTNYAAIAEKYSDFIKKWIKSAVWYEENWNKMTNLYPDVPLSNYHFLEKEPRFKDHFIDFARCLSHYAKTQEEYVMLLDEEYKSHNEYRKLIGEKILEKSIEKQNELKIEEEIIEDEKCSACQEPKATYWHKGKPFCLNCFTSLQISKVH